MDRSMLAATDGNDFSWNVATALGTQLKWCKSRYAAFLQPGTWQRC